MKFKKQFPEKVNLKLTRTDFKQDYGDTENCTVANAFKRQFKVKEASEGVQDVDTQYRGEIIRYRHPEFGFGEYNRWGKKLRASKRRHILLPLERVQ